MIAFGCEWRVRSMERVLQYGSVREQWSTCTQMVAVDVPAHVKSAEGAIVYKVGGVYRYIPASRVRTILTIICWFGSQAGAAAMHPSIQEEHVHCYQAHGNSFMKMWILKE